ncbi:MAG: PIN domain-containing protein [Verrucomicrobia bacterium]|nr:PIN domain-containing protein [Verrucomicrobiota bacterium]
MAAVRLICDTGPLVAFFNRQDQYHRWAADQFDRISGPLLTCEAVISEVVFLLQDDGLTTDPLFEAVERGKLLVQFSAEEHWADLRRLVRKYEDLPMSLADACLVRMAELAEHCQVFTTDRHFRIYRRSGRHLIPMLAPF